MTRLVVTGSRYGHPDVERVLTEWVAKHGIPDVIILGDAAGVDAQAYTWARDNDLIEVALVFSADWKRHGRKAGPMRNGRMIAYAGKDAHVVAFPCPKSIGTWDCVRQAQAAGLQVTVIDHVWMPSP